MAFNMLLVDDSATTRAMIGKTLRLSDVDVGELFEASDGAEALDVLRDHWVDIVFADLNMPGMDGLELIERMRADGLLDTVPVVVVSADGGADRMDELCRNGVAAYVRKPFTPERLGRLVAEMLAGPVMDTEIVATAFCDALEGFAFLTAERAHGPSCGTPDEATVARIAFVSSRFSGTMELAVPVGDCSVIAASALGAEPAAGVGDDAVKELLNVVCGHALAAALGENAVFDLTPPDLRSEGAGAWCALASDARTHAFDVEGIPMLLSITVENER